MASQPIEQPAEEPPALAEPVEPVQLSEVEELAVEMGWRPEAEYTGPKEKWKPAKDWVKAGVDIDRGLKRDVRSLRDTVDRLASASSKQTERALKLQAEQIEQRFADAVEAKDTKAAAAAAKDMRELEQAATPPSSNVESDFARRNPWYGKDDEATAYAISVSQREAQRGKTVEQQLTAVESAMKKRFPELFDEAEPPPRRQAPLVNAPTGRTTTTRRDKSFSDLPTEAKRAAEDYAKLFKDKHGIDPEKSKADYAKDYFANIEA